MALGEFTRQLAKQAISDQVSELLDTKTEKQTKPAGPEGLGGAIFAQIQAMQRACKDEQELAIYLKSGEESIRIVEIFLPSPELLVLTGFDPERNLTRVISPAPQTQLLCKILKLQPGATATKVNLLLPKPRE